MNVSTKDTHTLKPTEQFNLTNMTEGTFISSHKPEILFILSTAMKQKENSHYKEQMK